MQLRNACVFNDRGVRILPVQLRIFYDSGTSIHTRMVRVGYACVSVQFQNNGLTTSHAVRMDTLRALGPADAERALDNASLVNVDTLERIIEYNERVGIRFFRIASHMFPHVDNPAADAIVGHERNIAFARPALERAGALARRLGHRLTFHPDHFTQLGSPRADIVARSVRDLGTFARVFEYLGYTPELGSVMVFHGGGGHGDKTAALERFERTFRAMPETTRRFVALENDEFTYSIADLLPMCERLGIPLVVDVFHHSVMFPDTWQALFDDAHTLDRISAIWRRRGIVQKIHVSSQAPGARPGTHADFIDADAIRFGDIMRLCVHYGADIMCECKFKEACAMRILERYFVRGEHEDGRIWWRPRD